MSKKRNDPYAIAAAREIDTALDVLWSALHELDGFSTSKGNPTVLQRKYDDVCELADQLIAKRLTKNALMEV